MYLELPRDRVFDPCDPVQALPATPFDPDAVSACADEVMARLAEAAKPVMMVGSEVRRYGIEARVAELVRRLHVPVVTSFMGRGLLAGSGAPVLGTYLGLTAHPDVGRPVEESDCLLLFGVTVSDTNFGVAEGRVDLRRAIVAADRSVSMGYHRYANIPLAALVDELGRRVEDASRAPRAARPSTRAASRPTRRRSRRSTSRAP